MIGFPGSTTGTGIVNAGWALAGWLGTGVGISTVTTIELSEAVISATLVGTGVPVPGSRLTVYCPIGAPSIEIDRPATNCASWSTSSFCQLMPVTWSTGGCRSAARSCAGSP